MCIEKKTTLDGPGRNGKVRDSVFPHVAFSSSPSISNISDFSTVWEKRVENAAIGYERFPDGEVPPPSALAGRRVIGQEFEREKPKGKLLKSLNEKLFGTFDRDAPLGGPSRAGESTKQDRRRTVIWNPQDETILGQTESSQLSGRLDAALPPLPDRRKTTIF